MVLQSPSLSQAAAIVSRGVAEGGEDRRPDSRPCPDTKGERMKLPGKEIANRPLRFYWVLDLSSSMLGNKIGQLNHAIREALPAMRDVADDNAYAAVEVKVLTFATGAKWHTPAPVPLDSFQWTDVSAGGITDMGAAMSEMAEELSTDNMPERGLPPVIVLITDGHPTDNFARGLRELQERPWAQRAVRIAIGIGDDADLDVLRQFIDHAEIEPLNADNSRDLVSYIRWASTTGLKTASAPGTRTTHPVENPSIMDALPDPPPSSSDVDDDDDDVF